MSQGGSLGRFWCQQSYTFAGATPLPTLAGKRNRNLRRAHLALTPSDALLPAPTLSAGKYRVSGGKLKVSRQAGLPRNPRARRLKPK